MMAFALVMPFTACDDDNDTTSETVQHDPASDEDQTEVTAYDALDWLQNSIVVIDENGEVVTNRVVDMKVVTDERICDGYYFANAFKLLKRCVEDPERLTVPPKEVIEDID